MPRNVEIKARVNADLKELIERVFCFTKLNTLDLTTFTQEDTFFQLPNDKNGMLKLRKNQMVSLHGMMPWVQKVLSAQNDLPELIYYNRQNDTGPKLSTYSKCNVTKELKSVLTNALGTWGEVKKTRSLLLVGQTRVHFDTVEGLGNFVELEVVLKDEQTVEEGQKIAIDLMSQMGLEEKDLISVAYVDLLSKK